MAAPGTAPAKFQAQGPLPLPLSQLQFSHPFSLPPSYHFPYHSPSVSPQDTNSPWKPPARKLSLAQQVMSTQAAARNQPPSSSSPSQSASKQPKEDGRDRLQNGTNGVSSNLVPPPSAPPSLMNAVKSINSAQDSLATLRERPLAAPKAEDFDSPYARSAMSTAPGSPRM